MVYSHVLIYVWLGLARLLDALSSLSRLRLMATRVSHFEIDWCIIQKRAVYIGALILVLCVMAGGVVLYVWKYGNPLKNVALHSAPLAGARFMSFEGDVRVVRAATRQIVIANNDVQLYPGDTVQTQADGRARI